MSLREEMWKYEQITGESAEHVPIIKLGAFLDGYELAIKTLEQKVGKWIAQDIHNCHTDFKCSECGYIHSFTHLYGEPTADYTYCPRCGAKMEVEE